MILYNLPPSVHSHYSYLITTTGQSVSCSALRHSAFGLSPLCISLGMQCKFP